MMTDKAHQMENLNGMLKIQAEKILQVVYIFYMITNDKGHIKKGKLAIIR